MADPLIMLGSLASAFCLLGASKYVRDLMVLDKEMSINRKNSKSLRSMEAPTDINRALEEVKKLAEVSPNKRATMEAFVTGRTARGSTIARNLLGKKSLPLSAQI